MAQSSSVLKQLSSVVGRFTGSSASARSADASPAKDRKSKLEIWNTVFLTAPVQEVHPLPLDRRLEALGLTETARGVEAPAHEVDAAHHVAEAATPALAEVVAPPAEELARQFATLAAELRGDPELAAVAAEGSVALAANDFAAIAAELKGQRDLAPVAAQGSVALAANDAPDSRFRFDGISRQLRGERATAEPAVARSGVDGDDRMAALARRVQTHLGDRTLVGATPAAPATRVRQTGSSINF